MPKTIATQLDREIVERVREKAIENRRSLSAQCSYYIELGMKAEVSPRAEAEEGAP